MTHEEAIKWLKMQSRKPVKWNDYSEENRVIREEAERRLKEAYNMAIEALKAQEPTQWHKEGCANNSSVCVVDIGNDMPALLAAVVVNGRFIFDGLDITEKVRHWFAIPGIKADGQAVKWE